MHDSAHFDSTGIPALVVSSTAFKQAAAHQADLLGYDPTIVWVPHPIQDRTDAELRDIADKVLDEIIARMTAQA